MDSQPQPQALNPVLLAAIEVIVTNAVERIRDDELLDSTGASTLIYGRPAVRPFIRLRQRHREIDQMAVGPPRQRRWRRGDLRRWVEDQHPRVRREANA